MLTKVCLTDKDVRGRLCRGANLRHSRVLIIFGLAIPLFGQVTPYQGPAVLTRGQAPAAMATPQVDLRPFVEVTGVYDTGLTGVIVDDKGQLAEAEAGGVEIAGGISGVHSWKHTLVGLDYRGAFRHYTKQTYYDGTDQALLLGVTQQLSRHTALVLREAGGLFSRDVGVPGIPQTVPFDPATSFIPTTDFFDNRTLYLSTQADFTYQRSARLSFDAGGDGFLARRRSSALYGVTGGGAHGDVQYRLSRRTTIGVGYQYTHFDFTGVFSGTDLHTFVGSYAIRLSRSLEFTAYAGAIRAETKFIQSIPVDPVVAALLGQSNADVIVHRIDYLPTVQARISDTLRSGVIYATGGHTVTPGNGLFLTSEVTSIAAGYTYTGLRRWSFNAQAAASIADSVANYTGRYNSYNGILTVSRQISGSVHAIVSFGARQYDSPDFSNYHRLIYNARVGIGFSPGDIPLRLW